MDRMKINKRMVAIITVCTFTLTGCGSININYNIPEAAASGQESAYDGFFDNDEINKLIDANYKEVEQNGWAELRIPEEVHGIGQDSFSDNALDAAHKLIDSGYEAYIIGGAIRDLVMGTETMDFDITTNASNDQISKVFENARFHAIPSGLEFAFVEYPGEVIDVASCVNIPAEFHGVAGVPDFDPNEMYSDNFVADSFERDLTINALYYDVKTGELVDYHGGLHDIREGIIQTMVDPAIALDADPRISIRGMRFKARYGFDLSDGFDKAMRENVGVYVTKPGPGSNSFNVPKFFDAGYAYNSYEVLDDYGAFDVLFAPVDDICQTDDYKSYMEAATKQMDAWEAEGDEIGKDLYIAVILWPEFEGMTKEEVEKSSAGVLAKQNETISINEEDTDDYIDLFVIECLMEQDMTYDEAAGLVMQNEFEDAYDLLVIRSLTDDSLEDEVDYWTEMRNEVLYEDSDIAA